MPRIAHISDLHFSHLTLSPLQFFSKRWVGNGNLFFKRNREYSDTPVKKLLPLFQEISVDWVFITGDLTTTGQKKEFLEAKNFLSALSEMGKNILTIAGNHDNYTRRDYKKKLFYQFFTNSYSKSTSHFETLTLCKDQIELRPLFGNWWYLALETAIPTSIVSSCGLFSEKLEEKLKQVLEAFPKEQKILFLNHFPFFQFDTPRKTLLRGMRLHDILKKSPQVIFYLHGHTHRHCIADLRCDQLPIILDSGSAAYKNRASFNLLDIEDKSSTLRVFRYKDEKWQESEKKDFFF